MPHEDALLFGFLDFLFALLASFLLALILRMTNISDTAWGLIVGGFFVHIVHVLRR